MNKTLMLKEEVVLALINTIRRKPILWKQNAPGYRDLTAQQQAWQSVANQYGVPVEQLKLKWRMLRTQFRSNLSKIRYKRMEGTGELNYQPTWFAFEAMKFLRDIPELNAPGTTTNATTTATSQADVSLPTGEPTLHGYPEDIDTHEICLELINRIKHKPILWDKKHPEYSNSSRHIEEWREIADSMQLPVADIKRKWQHLRVQFRNNLKNIKIRSTPGCKYKPTWFAFDAMQFVRKNVTIDLKKLADKNPEMKVKHLVPVPVPKPSTTSQTPSVKPLVREYKRRNLSPIRSSQEKVQRIQPCTSTTQQATVTSSPGSAPAPPAAIRPVSYVTNGNVEPFIIRTFRNLSKITDKIAQTNASPYKGLLDHLAAVLERKRKHDFVEIEGVLLKCLGELQKFPNAKENVRKTMVMMEDDEESI
uniref:MADF domain-containing protein n=1 Tax=Anopheles epiroticus TaxID=199890 RepID=A0A182PGH4_9DIPT